MSEPIPTYAVGPAQFEDPFRWLERDDDRAHVWEEAQTQATLQALCTNAPLREALRHHVAADRVAAPIAAGDHWLWLDRGPDGGGVRVRRTARDATAGEVIFEVETGPFDTGERFDWIAPSPDGSLLALASSRFGDEDSILRLIDVATGETVAPVLPHCTTAVWHPDGGALLCAAGLGGGYESQRRRLAWVRPGRCTAWLDSPTASGMLLPTLQISPDGRWVAIATLSHFPHLRWLHDLASGAWLEIAADPDANEILFGCFAGNDYLAVTTDGAPRGRLIAAPIASIADRSAWTELVPEGDHVLRSVLPYGDDFLLYEVHDGTPVLRTVDRTGTAISTCPLAAGQIVSRPGWDRNQLAGDLPVSYDGQDILFSASSLGRSATVHRWRPGGQDVEQLTQPEATLDGLAWERSWAISADGHRVAYDRISRVGDTDRARPTLVYCYGGFNIAQFSEGYAGPFAAWLQAGGDFVFAHLRGDGTFGTQQWHSALREHRHRSSDDVFAVIDQLVVDGCPRGQVALAGASNGGLLVSTAITRRPELVGAAAVLVPLTDMGRLTRDRFGEATVMEFGDPEGPRDAAHLRALSPVHNVAPAEYPAMIVVTAQRDARTPSWHGRKLAAALQAAQRGDAPILYRSVPLAGHLTGGVGGNPDTIAEWMGFLLAHTGGAPR